MQMFAWMFGNLKQVKLRRGTAIHRWDAFFSIILCYILYSTELYSI